MNATLSKIIKSYSTDKHSKYISELHNLSKDRLIAIFTDLLTTYINDKNSSTLREYLTVLYLSQAILIVLIKLAIMDSTILLEKLFLVKPIFYKRYC